MKRKMISKIMAAALIGTMCAGMAVPVMAADDEKVTLSVINYHVGTDYAAEYYSYLFEAFQQTEEGKNVEFSFEEIPTTDAFNQKIKLLISSGDLPDIVFNGGNNIIELAAKSGKVADLTPYLDADPEWKSLFDDTSLEFNTVDGKIYGIPVSKEVSYIYYNKDPALCRLELKHRKLLMQPGMSSSKLRQVKRSRNHTDRNGQCGLRLADKPLDERPDRNQWRRWK